MANNTNPIASQETATMPITHPNDNNITLLSPSSSITSLNSSSEHAIPSAIASSGQSNVSVITGQVAVPPLDDIEFDDDFTYHKSNVKRAMRETCMQIATYSKQLEDMVKSDTPDLHHEEMKNKNRNISYLQQTYKNLKSTLYMDDTPADTSARFSPANTLASSSANTLARTSADSKESLPLPKDLPRFRLKRWQHLSTKERDEAFDTCHDFLDDFEQCIEANGIDSDKHWERCMKRALLPLQFSWFKAHVRGRGFTWDKYRELFNETYDTDRGKAKVTALVYSLKMGTGDSLQSFVDKFQKARRDAGMKDSEELGIRFLEALPAGLQLFVQISQAASEDTSEMTLDRIVRMAKCAGISTRVHSALAYITKGMEESEYISAGKKAEHMQSSATHLTSYNSHANHGEKRQAIESEEQRPAKRLRSPLTPTPAPTATPYVARTRPCRYGCGEDFKPGHWCPNYPKRTPNDKQTNDKKTYAVRTMKIKTKQKRAPKNEVDSDANSSDSEIVEHFRHQSLGKLDSKPLLTHLPDKSTIVPVILQNERLFALVDTGAEVSALDQKIVNKLKLKVHPGSGQLLMADRQFSIDRIGITEPVDFSHNGKKIKHSFEVMNLSKGVDVSIGTDIMIAIGISLGGLATSWISSSEQSAGVDPDAEMFKNIDIPNESPAGTPEEHAQFMNAIEPLVKDNQSIPTTSFCTHPQAVVYLHTTPGKVSYRRQYPLPRVLQRTVQEQVEKWAKDGIISRAPVNCAWNSPLTFAPKKDSQGNLTAKRPCLDPRHINEMLPDDKYPIPLIRDVFQTMKNAA